MNNSDLLGAIRHLERLEGYPATAVSGWLQAAKERQAVDQVRAVFVCTVAAAIPAETRN